jgi:hypothetical protein
VGRGPDVGQRNSKYAMAVGTHLLAKIHCLELKLGEVGHQQNHPIDCIKEHVNFIGDRSDCVGRVVDKLNSHIDAQEVQIQQLANMVNNLVGKTEGQAKEVQLLKNNHEEHCKVINTLTAKVIMLEQCVEDVQRKAFPQVGGHCQTVDCLLTLLLPCRLLWHSLVSKLLCCLIRWWPPLFMVSAPIEEVV